MKLRLSNTRDTTLQAVHRLTVSVMLVACCGCPTGSSSREERIQATTSQWITVESADGATNSSYVLDDSTLNEITNALPTISNAVGERVRQFKIDSEIASTEATVCGTSPQYIRLLRDVARVEIEKGRFIESTDGTEDAPAVVLTESLAITLFMDADPVGQSVVLQDQKLTVVGVVSDGAKWGADVTREAYVPLNLAGPGTDQSAPFRYDRFRFQVESLDQVDDSKSIIRTIIERRHPSQNIRVR